MGGHSGAAQQLSDAQREVGLVELHAGEVHSHLHLDAVAGFPLDDLLAHGLQYPLTQPQDQPRLLGNGNELTG